IGALALIPLAFAEAANGAWLTAVLATVGIFMVGFNIAVLARRYVTAGALYNFVPQGLGRWSGFVVAVTLMGLVGIAGPFFAIGFGQAFTGFLGAVGIYHAGTGGTFVFEILVIVATSSLAYFDIRLSTTVLLTIELVSMTLIFVLLMIILAKSKQVFDTN